MLHPPACLSYLQRGLSCGASLFWRALAPDTRTYKPCLLAGTCGEAPPAHSQNLRLSPVAQTPASGGRSRPSPTGGSTWSPTCSARLACRRPCCSCTRCATARWPGRCARHFGWRAACAAAPGGQRMHSWYCVALRFPAMPKWLTAALPFICMPAHPTPPHPPTHSPTPPHPSPPPHPTPHHHHPACPPPPPPPRLPPRLQWIPCPSAPAGLWALAQ